MLLAVLEPAFDPVAAASILGEFEFFPGKFVCV